MAENRFLTENVADFAMTYLDIKKGFHVSDSSWLEQVTKRLIQFIEIVGTFTN